MKYHILMTEKAEEQMRELLYYIADDSGNVDIALKLVGKIKKAIYQLEDFPYMGRVPQYSILRRQKYRVLIAEKYLVFYKVDEGKKAVIIYAVISSRREYERLL